MNLKNLTPSALRAYADQLEATQRMEADLFGGETIAPVVSKTKRARVSRAPSASGARKSIVHPNANDVLVLNAMLRIDGHALLDGDKNPVTPAVTVFKADEVVAESGLAKDIVKPAINFLKQAGKITTHGRGRGTQYSLNVTSNDLQEVDPSTLGDSYRKSGGPKVIECVRAVFNTLEPEQKVTPGTIIEMAQQLFPEKNLKKSSFGQVFTNMERNGETKSEGKAKSRFYWRGSDKLPGAAEIPEGFAGYATSDSVSDDSATDPVAVSA
jgi:hypothetical protein